MLTQGLMILFRHEENDAVEAALSMIVLNQVSPDVRSKLLLHFDEEGVGRYLSIRHTKGEITADVTAAEATSMPRREATRGIQYSGRLGVVMSAMQIPNATVLRRQCYRVSKLTTI